MRRDRPNGQLKMGDGDLFEWFLLHQSHERIAQRISRPHDAPVCFRP